MFLFKTTSVFGDKNHGSHQVGHGSQWCLRIWPPWLKLTAGPSHLEVVVFADNDSSIAPKPCRFMRGTALSSALQLTFQAVACGSYFSEHRTSIGPSHITVVQMWGVGQAAMI